MTSFPAMTVPAITTPALAPPASLAPHDGVAALPASARPAAALPFGQLVSEGLRAVNEQLLASQADLQGLALGETRNLHEVMVRLEESRLSLQLLMQVRGRLIEAYQDVMRMQV